MPSFPIIKYDCKYCVVVKCDDPECGWVSSKPRDYINFSPCMDCGAEWWTLLRAPARHRADHHHLKLGWTSKQTPDTVTDVPPDGTRKRGRPRIHPLPQA